MRRRRPQKKWRKWRAVLIILLFSFLAFESRFYVPRRIRPSHGVEPVEVEMKITSYCHCGKCCSYHWLLFIPFQKTGFMRYRLKHVGKTSSGTLARPGTIAADTSIYPYGTVMYIPGYGYGRVEDTGGAIAGKHIDLYRPNHWYALKWGVQMKRVKVWLPATAPPRSVDSSDLRDDVTTNMPADEADVKSSLGENESTPMDKLNAISIDGEDTGVEDEG